MAVNAEEHIAAAMALRGRVLVAYSGGVDSALVAKIAQDTLGADALAVITDTETLSRRELHDALATAAEIGIECLVVPMSELGSAAYRENRPDRCYFCRQGLAGVLVPLAAARGFPAIADGVHRSDLGDVRPGIRAMDEAGFWHPLLEAGLDKGGVRTLAADLGLSVWDRPSNACLSSRVRQGELITLETLRRVEAAEEVLHDLEFRQVRVRHSGTSARVEVGSGEVPRLLSPPIAASVTERLRSLGYAEVELDPAGYRQGGA